MYPFLAGVVTHVGYLVELHESQTNRATKTFLCVLLMKAYVLETYWQPIYIIAWLIFICKHVAWYIFYLLASWCNNPLRWCLYLYL